MTEPRALLLTAQEIVGTRRTAERSVQLQTTLPELRASLATACRALVEEDTTEADSALVILRAVTRGLR